MPPLTILIVIYIIFLIFVAIFVAINVYNLIRFKLDKLEHDYSRMMLFTYLAIVIAVFFVSVVGAIMSYNL